MRGVVSSVAVLGALALGAARPAGAQPALAPSSMVSNTSGTLTGAEGAQKCTARELEAKGMSAMRSPSG